VQAAPSVRADAPEVRFTDAELRRIRRLSPLPGLPPDPSNAVADDPRAARLGEQLFFEPRLAAGGERSCASCHDPRRHWTDGRRVSSPDARFPKNVPSLWNTAYNRWYFWDGRADSAWAQALGPLESDDEMASSRLAILHLVRGDPDLRAGYVEVFGALPDGLDDPRRFPLEGRPVPASPDHPLHRAWASMSDEDRYQANVAFTDLGKALAAFERRIVTRDTPFDRFVAGLADRGGTADAGAGAVLDAAAMRGLKLFVGRGSCTLCHSGPLLSDGEFHDVGIALGTGMRVDPGRYGGVLELLRSPFTRVGRYADAVAPAAPIRFLDKQSHQLGQFKTPSLRGAADTAPYMHDGRFATLKEVVRFYSTRDGALPLGHPTTLLQPLGLSEREIADLVAFLESLSHEPKTRGRNPIFPAQDPG
jgi:cytochrome c peroxidase